jgi:Ion transport protein/Cyclic nucleotide-binding domain
MAKRQNTLSQSYLKLLKSKSVGSNNENEYKKVFNHVKLMYKKEFTMSQSLDSVMNEHPKCLFKPDQAFKLSWDIYMLLIMTYLAISIPFYIGFYIPITGVLVYIEFVTQVSLILDVFITINTSYFVKGALVTSRKKIAWSYFKSWLWPDLFSSFPYSWFIKLPFENEPLYNYTSDFVHLTQFLSVTRVLRLVKTLNLIKLVKARKVLVAIEDALVNHKMVISFVFLKLIVFMMLVAHWAACVWNLSAMETSTTDSVTWKKVFETSEQRELGVAESYVTALYWAFTTMATVGYGDIHAYSLTEMIIDIVTMATSSTIFAYILGTFSSLIKSASAKETTHREIIIAVNRYMKKAKLPTDLQFRVRRYLDYVYKSQNKSDIAEENIMQMLSLNLKDEIYTFLHGNIINSCNFFKSGGLSSGILSQLHRILKFEAYAPEDSVFKQGETSRTLYFILSGRVNLHHQNTSYSYITLESRTCFGEIGFFVGKPRSTSAKCIGFTEFFSVLYEDFENLIRGNPEDLLLIETVKEKCQDEDYTILQIHCYLCSNLGHIANTCKLILFNLDKEKQKNSKINKQEVKSKVIKLNKTELNTRKRNPVFLAKGFKSQSSLGEKIQQFSINKKDSLRAPEIKLRRNQEKSYSFIYNITEFSQEDEDDKIKEFAPVLSIPKSSNYGDYSEGSING